MDYVLHLAKRFKSPRQPLGLRSHTLEDKDKFNFWLSKLSSYTVCLLLLCRLPISLNVSRLKGNHTIIPFTVSTTGFHS